MGVGSGLYMYDVVVKRSHSLSHLLMSSCVTYGKLQVGLGQARCSIATERTKQPIDTRYAANKPRRRTCTVMNCMKLY